MICILSQGSSRWFERRSRLKSLTKHWRQTILVMSLLFHSNIIISFRLRGVKSGWNQKLMKIRSRLLKLLRSRSGALVTQLWLTLVHNWIALCFTCLCVPEINIWTSKYRMSNRLNTFDLYKLSLIGMWHARTAGWRRQLRAIVPQAHLSPPNRNPHLLQWGTSTHIRTQNTPNLHLLHSYPNPNQNPKHPPDSSSRTLSLYDSLLWCIFKRSLNTGKPNSSQL